MTKQNFNSVQATSIVRRVAERVRAARKTKGLPRRVVSEMSGVSPRYLAQIEAGEGNISIVLLSRVAEALGTPIEDLLREDGPPSDDTARVAGLYAAAPPLIQGRVRALLSPKNPIARRAHRICLVGLRGAGKSTLGKMAADKLHIPFVELNDEIEKRAGMPLDEVMALYGLDGFRVLESEAVENVIGRYDKLILAVAGGVVADDETYGRVRDRFHTIWIRTSPAEHMARVRAQGDLRPMEGNPAAMDQLKSFLTARTPQYEKALAQVDTTGKPVGSSLNDLLTVIASNRFLDAIGE